MIAREHPLCDCPEPCACYVEGYAAGKDKAYFEMLASLEATPHAGDCACRSCQVKRACLQKVMTLMARRSPTPIELVEVWVLEDQDGRSRNRDRFPVDASAPSDVSGGNSHHTGRSRRAGRRQSRGPQLVPQHQARLGPRLEGLH